VLKLAISIFVGGALTTLGLLLYWKAETRNIIPVPPPSPKHPVTAEMRQKSEALVNSQPEKVYLKSAIGGEVSLAQLQEGRPMLVYFIKDGCPCSIESEPMFQELYQHLNDNEKINVPFVGIIGSDLKIAQKWVDKFQPPYEVLSAPTQKIMAAYKAPRSVYSILLSKEGKVIKQWPGWSKRILTEINAESAKAANLAVKPFDPKYAPTEDSAGCSFDEAIAAIEDAQIKENGRVVEPVNSKP
jgi:peroxiredoxin